MGEDSPNMSFLKSFCSMLRSSKSASASASPSISVSISASRSLVALKSSEALAKSSVRIEDNPASDE